MSRRHTILVVDDEPDVVKSVQDLLRFDYRVLGATRAKDGIEIMSREEVHVVMTDQRMPEITGVEFLGKIRHEHPDAVRLIFTGYADIKAVIDAINEGNVYRYINKPWDPDELESVIREACERHDLLVERQRLLAELKVKNEQLTRANSELQQANDLKRAFIEVVSHELRTPLTILLGLSGLASRTEGMSGVLQDRFKRMNSAAVRLQHLVDQTVSMLAAGQFELQLERTPTDLGALLRQAADDVRPFAEMRRQTLRVELASDLGMPLLDPPKIRDCVNHLLLNAIKFTPDDGCITFAARRTADAGVEIVVSDNGCGIAPAALPRLFQPFFTGFDTTHHSSGQFEFGRKGLGLGLSVVKALTEKHGGSVGVQSAVGEGTTFTMRLPAGALVESAGGDGAVPMAAGEI